MSKEVPEEGEMIVRTAPMRYRAPQYRGFGALSPVTKGDCPAGGSWEAWCDCMWPADKDAAMNRQCRNKPMGLLTAAPWTDIGAMQRGLPKPGGLVDQLVTSGGGLLQTILAGGQTAPTSTPPPPPPVEESEGILGLSKPVALGGFAIMLAGVGALVYRRMSR